MIAKVIASGVNRDAAIARMRQALSEIKLEGVGNNIAFLSDVLSDPDFQKVDITTNYIDKQQK